MFKFGNTSLTTFNQAHELTLGATIMAAVSGTLSNTAAFTVIEVISEKISGWTSATSSVPRSPGMVGDESGNLLCQFSIYETAGTFTAQAVIKKGGTNRTLTITDSGVSWDDFSDRTVFAFQVDGDNIRFTILDANLGRYNATASVAGVHFGNAVDRLQLGGSDDIASTTDIQTPHGVLGPMLVIEGAIDFDDLESAFNANDLGAIVRGPSSAWEDDILAGICLSNDTGNSSTPIYVPGAQLATTGGTARVSVYGKGVTSYDNPETFVNETAGVLNVGIFGTYFIECVNPADYGWGGSGLNTTATDSGDLANPAPIMRSIAGGNVAGQKILAVVGNSRVSATTPDLAIVNTRNTTGLTTDDTGAAVNHHIAGSCVRNYAAGILNHLAGLAIGSGRGPRQGTTRSWPFASMTGTAMQGNNTAYLASTNDAAYDQGVGKFGIYAEEDVGESWGSVQRINPDDWASGGDSTLEVLMTCNLGMQPGDSRRVVLAFLKAPQMSSSVEIRIMGGYSGGTTNPVTQIISTPATTVDLSNPDTSMGGINTVNGQTIEMDSLNGEAVLQVGRMATFRKSGEPGTAVALIASNADTGTTTPEFTTEFQIGGTGGSAIADTDTVEIGQWDVVRVAIDIPNTLFGTGAGQIRNSLVGVQIKNTDASYPAYLLADLKYSTERSGVAVVAMGQGGVSYAAANNTRSKIVNPDTGKTALRSVVDALGVDTMLFTGADQLATTGSGATTVSNALGVMLDELNGIERVVSVCPHMGGWGGSNDRRDYANKARTIAAARSLPFIDMWSDRMGGTVTHALMAWRHDDAHFSTLGSKEYARQVMLAATSAALLGGVRSIRTRSLRSRL